MRNTVNSGRKFCCSSYAASRASGLAITVLSAAGQKSKLGALLYNLVRRFAPVNRVKEKLSLACATALLVFGLAPSPVRAITNGIPDTNNTFSNVGAVLVLTPDGQQAFQLCSGTLIAPTV